MPKVDIDHETLDGLVIVGLNVMLNTMIDLHREEKDTDDKKRHAKDIEALERVLRLYQ